jgi:sulfur-carrier protein
MSKIHIPTPLRQYVGKEPTVDVKGTTVGEAMNALVALYPEVRRHLYTEDGKLRSFVNLYVNDEDIRYLQKEETAVKDGDSISIVPSIAGGADQRFCHADSFVIPSEARDLGFCLFSTRFMWRKREPRSLAPLGMTTSLDG